MPISQKIAVVAICLAASAPAYAQMTTVLGGHLGYLSASGGAMDDTDAWVAGVDGSIALGFGGSFLGQIDLNFETTDAFEDGDPRQYQQLGIHGIYRIANFDIGLFAVNQQMTQMNEGTGKRRAFGIEAAFNTSSASFFAQYAKSDHISGDEDHAEPVDADLRRIGVRYYLGSNAAITGEYLDFRAPDVETGSQGPVEQKQFSISYERQLAAPGWSWNIGVSTMRYQDDSHSADPIKESQIQIGFTLVPGASGSLQDRDRRYAWWGLPREIRGTTYVDSSYAHD